MDAAERRVSDRLQVMRPAQYSVGKRLLIGELLDIGESGLRLRTTAPLPVGTVVKIHLALASSGRFGAKTYVLSAEVIWQHGPTVGLEFGELPLDARVDIRHLLDREALARAT